MTLTELKNAYPDIPDQCHNTLVNTARTIASAQDKTRKLSTGLIIAFAILLVLTGIAYAAVQWGVVDYLLGRSMPSMELYASTQKVFAAGEADGIVLTVTGAVYDGERLALSWTVENKKPRDLASYYIKNVSFSGVPVDAEFGRSQKYNDWSPLVRHFDRRGR